MGFIFQNFQLLPTLTALENVMVPLELKKRKDAKEKALSLLKKVGLGDRVTHYPTQLSGGEQQRVSIARAFANEPLILFADEPTGNLDTETGEMIEDLIFNMNKEEGTTLVLVTHDPDWPSGPIESFISREAKSRRRPMADFSWILLMAYRDFRKNFSRLLLFVSSMVVGIAALVGISSFGENLKKDIEDQSKELVGADLVLRNNKPLGLQPTDSIAVQTAEEVNFASMVAFPATGESRLTQVRMLEGDFPFYGKLETIPGNAESTFRQGGRKALVEKLLMAQFNAVVGDSIKVGELTFVIEGELQKVPGQTGITATVAPAVYLPMEYAEATGLINTVRQLPSIITAR